MTKLKMIAVCLVFWTALARGITPAGPQVEGANRGDKPPEQGAEPSKRPPPPLITQKADYVVEAPDLVNLKVEETLPGRPIDGDRLVRPDGTISLSWYGDLEVAGLTVPEIKTRLIGLLRKSIRDDTLGLVELDASGEPVIDPATGKPRQIDAKDSKKVCVEVAACNSKCFYVQGEVRSPGRFPLTGTESVIDAIKTAGGLSPVADAERVFLYRENSRRQPECHTLALNQIKEGKLLSTHDRLKAGDRLVVHRRVGAVAPANDDGAERLKVGSEDPSMQQFEKRLNELELKLDRILDAIKRRAP